MKLNPYSVQLLYHMKTGPKIHTTKFSKHTRTFFTNVLNQIQKIDDVFHSKPPTKIEPPDYKHADLYNSIPLQIRGIIENQPMIQESYKFSIKTRIIRVHFIVPEKTPNIKIATSIQLIHTWFHFISPYAKNPKCASSLDLYLYWTNHPKVLPNKMGEPIEQIHANTAFTWACVENSTIQIFREEEWFKVLIHESFHVFGLDFSTIDITASVCSKKIRDWFSIQTEGLLFESYCELWATILNATFLAYYSESSSKNKLIKIENIIELETKYAVFQSIKVLKHYGLTYKDLVYKTSHTAQNRRKYREKTNVFCYNVLKTIMLYNWNNFLQWCIKHNHNVIVFQKTEDNLENLCNWIQTHYKTTLFLEDIRKVEDWFPKDSATEDFVYNTMRMTIFG